MVVAGGGTTGGSGGGGGGGAFGGRNGIATGLPLVVSGPPPHPHGPLIRGNLVPRLLAPLPGGGGAQNAPHVGGAGTLPLYAIVKPQQQHSATTMIRSIVGGNGGGGGPTMHVVVAAHPHPGHVVAGGINSGATATKLGPATAPGNTLSVFGGLMWRSGRKRSRRLPFYVFPFIFAFAWLLCGAFLVFHATFCVFGGLVFYLGLT